MRVRKHGFACSGGGVGVDGGVWWGVMGDGGGGWASLSAHTFGSASRRRVEFNTLLPPTHIRLRVTSWEERREEKKRRGEEEERRRGEERRGEERMRREKRRWKMEEKGMAKIKTKYKKSC